MTNVNHKTHKSFLEPLGHLKLLFYVILFCKSFNTYANKDCDLLIPIDYDLSSMDSVAITSDSNIPIITLSEAKELSKKKFMIDANSHLLAFQQHGVEVLIDKVLSGDYLLANEGSTDEPSFLDLAYQLGADENDIKKLKNIGLQFTRLSLNNILERSPVDSIRMILKDHYRGDISEDTFFHMNGNTASGIRLKYSVFNFLLSSKRYETLRALLDDAEIGSEVLASRYSGDMVIPSNEMNTNVHDELGLLVDFDEYFEVASHRKVQKQKNDHDYKRNLQDYSQYKLFASCSNQIIPNELFASLGIEKHSEQIARLEKLGLELDNLKYVDLINSNLSSPDQEYLLRRIRMNEVKDLMIMWDAADYSLLTTEEILKLIAQPNTLRLTSKGISIQEYLFLFLGGTIAEYPFFDLERLAIYASSNYPLSREILDRLKSDELAQTKQFSRNFSYWLFKYAFDNNRYDFFLSHFSKPESDIGINLEDYLDINLNLKTIDNQKASRIFSQP